MNPFSRRNFLKTGMSALALPVLESFPMPAHAAGVAQASGSLKRVMFFCLTNAWYEDIIFPTSTNYMTGPEGVRYIPLNSLTGDISQMFTAAKYGNLRSKMNLMRGFDLQSKASGGGGHRSNIALMASDERSATAFNTSFDNVLAASNVFYPKAPYKKSLVAVAASGQDSFRYNFSSTNSYLEGPTQIYKEFFMGTTLPNGSTTTTPPDSNLTRRLAMKGAMDKVRALSTSTRLSSSDKQKLSDHADLINKLLPSLAPPTGSTTTGVASCSSPSAPMGLDEKMSATSGNGNRLKAAMDLIYMSFNCQLTNLAVFHPVIAADDRSLPMGDDAGDIYHQIAGHHHEVANYLKYKGFVLDNLLYLLNRMDSTMESNGRTMLDNSLVVVVSNDACSVHSTEDLPVITFGTLGGALKAGNYINYQRLDAPKYTGSLDQGTFPGHKYNYNLGRPYNSFFTTVLNALGISHSGFGEYGLSDSTYASFVSAAGKQASLPILT